jgi:hypothetical protein
MRLALSSALALVALAASAAPALARTPTHREAEVAARITAAVPGVLRADCVTASNSLCVNATLWRERTAVVILFASVHAGTSPICPGYAAHSAAVARYVAALAGSFASPRSSSAAARSLSARRAWIAAYNRLARCSSFGWAT